ncbi:hypothetical protein BX616_002336 [Lobosporangium transversale]|uniref:Smg-4/UPF3 family-domain-containing protein n=1 Tax=Lobosporangium transversale TaxID=64571 RepID=A0A1Y2GGD8_9FUNG|nr:Smg-4/UPF3 family-domain-containing protein [Lobosporangium transversale]KAF9901220.1 hypothetical protein BX616_002336 [Lobosporangium transversale]ORZ10048.1 Smg-4/UPF3 family-domain-containing protein [Lobosporangium transversale]|eukprot:XP_021879138.1 Smg-4/UPF3 family-domain-containing protein [Lobosporangium transversale]
MSTAGGKATNFKRASRPKGPNRGQQKTKIVVRRLPANLPEHVFMESIKPFVQETSLERPTTWVAGKVSKNPVKGNTFARAYIYFKNEKLALEFQNVYHGHMFIDKQKNESRAFVEFAPFQKVPREPRKVDSKQGTIEQDPDYIAFLESLNAEPTEAEKEMKLSGTELLLKESVVNPKATPLLEALRAQKAAAQAKAQAAKIAARQARQAGKAGLSNATKGQITILINRNAKETSNNRGQSSNASAAANKNQQPQQNQPQTPQGRKSAQSAQNVQNADTENTSGSKPKRERRRNRASKKANADASSSTTGEAATPQITLLKPKSTTNNNTPAPSAQNPPSQSEPKQQNINSGSHGNQEPGNPSGRRGQQQQGSNNVSTNAKKDSLQTANSEGGSGRSSRSRRTRGDRAKQEAKAATSNATVANNNSGNTTNVPPASGNKGQGGQSTGGSGGSGRQGRSRRGRGGGQDNSQTSTVQG